MAYNVLVVDDSLPMRSVIKKTIKASGFKVGKLFEASNGREALDLLREEWLDLVLIDYNMPDMNGLELISEMKKDELLKSIPVIMTTVEGSQQRVKEFLEKGAADYIKKPFTPEEIRDKLYKVMGGTANGEESPDTGDEDFDF
jgi:two-component system chemotaxis response regulator CheY